MMLENQRLEDILTTTVHVFEFYTCTTFELSIRVELYPFKLLHITFPTFWTPNCLTLPYCSYKLINKYCSGNRFNS